MEKCAYGVRVDGCYYCMAHMDRVQERTCPHSSIFVRCVWSVCIVCVWDRYYRMKSHARSLHADGDDRTIVVRGGMGTTNEGWSHGPRSRKHMQCNTRTTRAEEKKLRMSNIKLNSTFADSPIHCIIHTCGMLCYMYVLIYRVSHVCFIDWAHRDREREHLRCAFLRMRFHYICRRASRTDMCHRNQLERPITQLASANNNK